MPDFIKGWGNADYAEHHEDREIIRGRIGWWNKESFKRFSKRFKELGIDQQWQIAGDISDPTKVGPRFQVVAAFFKRFRQLCVGGDYTHSATCQRLGYVGNVSAGRGD